MKTTRILKVKQTKEGGNPLNITKVINNKHLNGLYIGIKSTKVGGLLGSNDLDFKLSYYVDNVKKYDLVGGTDVLDINDLLVLSLYKGTCKVIGDTFYFYIDLGSVYTNQNNFLKLEIIEKNRHDDFEIIVDVVSKELKPFHFIEYKVYGREISKFDNILKLYAFSEDFDLDDLHFRLYCEDFVNSAPLVSYQDRDDLVPETCKKFGLYNNGIYEIFTTRFGVPCNVNIVLFEEGKKPEELNLQDDYDTLSYFTESMYIPTELVKLFCIDVLKSHILCIKSFEKNNKEQYKNFLDFGLLKPYGQLYGELDFLLKSLN